MPAYNERATLRASLERLMKTDFPVPLEIIVVDDGSSDGCCDTIGDLVDGEFVRLIRHEENQGKGAALATGIRHARNDLLTVMDADLEYDPGDYRQLLEPLLAGEARVVYGTRSFGGHTAFSFWYVIGNKLIALWASFLFDTWLSDLETCFKMAETELWRSVDLQSNGFGIEAEVTGKFLQRGQRIHEVPITYRARGREEGKKIDWTDGVEALWILFRLRLRTPRSRRKS